MKCGEPRGLPLEEILLPQRLKDLGYIARLVGKWHLGYHQSQYTPTMRGFHSHFGYWNGYVGYFDYKVDQGVSFMPKISVKDNVDRCNIYIYIISN